MPEGYRLEIMLKFPWISCLSLETTSWSTTADTTTTTSDHEADTTTSDHDVTTDEQATTDGSDPVTSKALSISFEARVSFSMQNTVTTDKTNDESSEKPLLEVLKTSTTLFWIAITLGSSLLMLITVITARFFFKKRGAQEGSLCVKYCYWLCQICLCPCKRLDKIRARECPRYMICLCNDCTRVPWMMNLWSYSPAKFNILFIYRLGTIDASPRRAPSSKPSRRHGTYPTWPMPTPPS